MTRNGFTLALLITAVSAYGQESPDIRYMVKNDQGYSVTIRVAPTGQVTVTQTKDNAKYKPIVGRVNALQVRVLKNVLRRPDGQEIRTAALAPTIVGPFSLEFEGYKIEGSRAALGEFAKYRLALEELEGIRDRLIDPQGNTVLLDFGAVKRRYFPPLKTPQVIEINVYMNGDVYLVEPAEKTEQTEQGSVNASSGGAKRTGPHFLTHSERRRLHAAYGEGVGQGGTRQVTPREMRVEFVFEPVKAQNPGPKALASQVQVRTTVDKLEGNLKQVSDVLDEIAARILAMAKEDEDKDAQQSLQGGIAATVQQE